MLITCIVLENDPGEVKEIAGFSDFTTLFFLWPYGTT
jgi:hypothetical protein